MGLYCCAVTNRAQEEAGMSQLALLGGPKAKKKPFPEWQMSIVKDYFVGFQLDDHRTIGHQRHRGSHTFAIRIVFRKTN